MLPVLVIIDIQRDYFPGGRHPLVGPDAIADTAARVLAWQRERNGPVIHVRHESPAGGGFLEVGTDGGRDRRRQAFAELLPRHRASCRRRLDFG